jgi:hypothetical protein
VADAAKQDAPGTGGAEIDELLRQGREAMAARRYQEARDRFDAALRSAPDDPRVQSLAVMAEFWRRLAREGDGFGPLPDAAARLRPKTPTGPVPGPAPTQVSPPRSQTGPAKAPPTSQ